MTEPTPLRPQAVRLLDCTVDALPQEAALRWCLETARSSPRARILLTANASHLVAMQDDPALRQAAAAADLVTPDGMSLVWAARLLGARVPERVTGIDLLEALLAEAPRQGLRVFLLGAKPAVIEGFVALCRERNPGIEIAGWRDGYFTPADHPAVVRQIAESRADMLFVAMPSPFKDVWCEQHRDAFEVKLIMGVGGAFDVLAGLVPRAPRWMQATGLEWAWRLWLEPRRLWKRYLVGNSRFLWLVLQERLRGPIAAVQAQGERAEDAARLVVRGGVPAGGPEPPHP
ncbi:WecB/TagA/CpsF family glycosyltransferase [Paracraurococcus lichenis]|uniref:WecB/TagA/CpsF family glycosyltransferase n=1 Tax=Paracraurococcus lichenis TaxID=3064888 RepID=A0ABT9E4H3_9PROT|nr:WecB/TagA/CpsF family glycosyltransferase [Paracraurococcus sp. LOR1-02]MDO9710975.1 WecB/TagA/CpsF family glycosyltransferase [Paracraurococcus sp. LOR1-02]